MQDQIVSCLCEFVEGNRTEIYSGWRPLFGTLRVANSNHNAAAILEVFQIFLSTDNTLVFANAALDYILCLLSHIKNANSPETMVKRKTVNEDNPDTEKKENDLLAEEGGDIDLCMEALKLLQNCATILSMMYYMPKCPTFNTSHRMNIDTDPQLVDAIIPNIEIVNLNQEVIEQMSYRILCTKGDMECCQKKGITLSGMDKPSGVLKIWYILVEGLSSATIVSAQRNQPCIMETLFKVLRDLIVNPGINFGLYCINHLLLPMVQNWLRQHSKPQKAVEIGQNFKHCCGMATELIVDYLHEIHSAQTKDEIGDEENPAVNLALRQLLLILVECISQATENVARLGTSCIRHLILNAGEILSVYQWEILVTAIHRACTVSLNPMQQVMLAFKEDSDSFYGDLANVKVAARRDSTVEDNERYYELARQVLLMQSQRNCNKCSNKACECEKTPPNITIDDRSYVFLLYPLDATSALNPELYSVRVPFRSVVIGVLAHQLLIQTVSSALLQNLNHITPILKILQINSYNLRGILTHVNAKHISILLKCLEVSTNRSREFDSKPGLKFLVQKVGNLSRAANLYTQANTSEVVQIIVLIELCLDGIEKYSIGPKGLKEIIARDGKEKCYTDIDYVEQFIRNLHTKWEYLCDSYVNLSIKIPPEKSEYESSNSDPVTENENQPAKESIPGARPFKLIDFKRADSFSSSDSESYLEQDALPNLKTEEHDLNRTKNSNEELPAPAEIKKAPADSVVEKSQYKFEMKAIKYDTNTLMQIRGSLSSDNVSMGNEDGMRRLETFDGKIDAMLDYGKHKVNQVLSPLPRTNPFLPPEVTATPQIPPEIQQQRAVSIFKVS